MIKQRRGERGVYIRSYDQLMVMMPFWYERENFFSAIFIRPQLIILTESNYPHKKTTSWGVTSVGLSKV